MEEAASKALTRADIAEWYLKSGHRRVWVVPLSLVLSIFVIFLVLRRMAEDPHANLLRSRAEILTWKRELPDERNALVAVSNSWKLRVVEPTVESSLLLEKIWENHSLLTTAESEAYWKGSQPEIQALKAALKMPEASSNYDPDNPKFWSPFFSLTDLRDSTRRLVFDAQMHTLRGNHDAAIESLNSNNRLAECVETDASLMGLLVTESVRGLPEDDFWPWLLNELPALDSATLKKYQGALDRSQRIFTAMVRSSEFERAQALYMMDMAYSARHRLGLRTAKAGHFDGLTYGSDRSCYEELIKELIGQLKRGEVPDSNPFQKSKFNRGPAPMTRMMFFAGRRSFHALAAGHSQRVLVYCALGVQQFQNKYSRDPKSMDELVPEFFSEAPTDFAGSPVKLRPGPFSEDVESTFYQHPSKNPQFALMLYTFGLNKRDDGGLNVRKTDDPQSADDIILLLRGVSSRGSKP